MRRDGRGLAELAGGLRLYPQKLINVRVAREFDWQRDGAIGQARAEAERRLGSRGRLLLRASGTEPVLRVMVEGEDEAEVAAIAAELAAPGGAGRHRVQARHGSGDVSRNRNTGPIDSRITPRRASHEESRHETAQDLRCGRGGAGRRRRHPGGDRAGRQDRRLQHGLPDHRGGRPRSSRRPRRARSRSRSASPAPAAASRSSAAARPTSRTPRGRSSRRRWRSARRAGIEYIELPVAFDALTVVVNPKNNFDQDLTVDELKKMWEPGAQGKVTSWNQVNPAWPERAAEAVRRRRRLRHVRLLHRGDHRQGEGEPRRLHRERGRQRARHRASRGT